jgi:hypothetical protein
MSRFVNSDGNSIWASGKVGFAVERYEQKKLNLMASVGVEHQ